MNCGRRGVFNSIEEEVDFVVVLFAGGGPWHQVVTSCCRSHIIVEDSPSQRIMMMLIINYDLILLPLPALYDFQFTAMCVEREGREQEINATMNNFSVCVGVWENIKIIYGHLQGVLGVKIFITSLLIHKLNFCNKCNFSPRSHVSWGNNFNFFMRSSGREKLLRRLILDKVTQL